MATTGGVAPERAQAGEVGRPIDPQHHVRTGRLRSIRLRLLLPIVVATAGLVVLGAVQTQFAVRTSLDARRAQVMASTATATVRLTHRLEQEIAETDALRARGGTSGMPLVTQDQAQTDLAAGGFRTAAASARDEAPALRPVLDAAEAQLARLSGIRDAVGTLKAGELSGSRYALFAGTATYSAKAPLTVSPIAFQFAHRLPRPAWHAGQYPQNSDGSTATRSPPRHSPGTPSPSATTRPANSWPGMIGYGVGGNSPSAMCRSVPQMPHAPTCTTSSPCAGAGSATSVTFSSPGFSHTTARIMPPRGPR